MNISNWPKGRYGVIVADPPWNFVTYSDKGHGKSAQRHYDCHSIEDICKLPVSDLAADHCALFLWTTWPMIFHAPRVLQAWGFKYSGLAWEWIKHNPETDKFAFGTGYGTRKNLEPCILARRGNPKVLSKSERDFLYAPRRAHSQKPDQQYERIERMYDGPYVELFANQKWKGWTAWGKRHRK